MDKNRAVAVVLGEKDNKEVLEKRKRLEKRERLKLNRSVDNLLETRNKSILSLVIKSLFHFKGESRLCTIV